jgi:hypothetical protein
MMAKIDLAQWDYADAITAQQAVTLVQGHDPSAVVAVDMSNSPLYGLMERCYGARRRWLQLEPDAEVNWADLGVESPEQMLESVEMHQRVNHHDGVDEDGAYRHNLLHWLTTEQSANVDGQRFSRSELARWLSTMKVKSEYKFLADKASEDDTPLGTKERSSLLKILLGMAIDGYGYNPADKKSEIPGQIEAAVKSIGLNMALALI